MNVRHDDERALLALLAGAEALLYPSEYEGFGLPVVEAMARGCPVVTRPIGALKEAGGEAAYYLSEPSVEALAEGMGRILDEPDLRRDLSQRGLAHAGRRTRREFADDVKAAIRESVGLPQGSRNGQGGPPLRSAG